jgi:hypothetical protein
MRCKHKDQKHEHKLYFSDTSKQVGLEINAKCMSMPCQQKAYHNRNIKRDNQSFQIWQSANKLTITNNIKAKSDM